MTEYYRVVAVIKPREPKKRGHNLRVGSAEKLPDGSILCLVDAAPLNWDGKLRLYPIDQEQENDNG